MSIDFASLLAETPDDLRDAAAREARLDAAPPVRSSRFDDIHAVRRHLRNALDDLPATDRVATAYAAALIAAEIAADTMTAADSERLATLLAMTAGAAGHLPDGPAREDLLASYTRFFIDHANEL